MKIAIIRHSIRDRGADRILFTYARHLIGAGHAVDYYVNEVTTGFVIPKGVVIKKIPYPGIAGTIAFALFHTVRADVILVDLAVMAFFHGLFHRRAPLCYLAQDYDVSYYRSALLKAWTRFCYKVILGKWQVPLLTESEALTAELKTYGPDWVRTIPNGTDIASFQKPLNARQTPAKKACALLYFSRSDYRKAGDVARKIFARLAAEVEAGLVEIWVIGETVRVEGVPVINLGFVRGDAYVEVLQKADIYLITSRSEGISTLLLDAMACRCAIVTTRAATMLTDGRDALVSDIDDGEDLLKNLKMLIASPERRAGLAEQAFVTVKGYDVKLSCERFERALQEAAERIAAGRLESPGRA